MPEKARWRMEAGGCQFQRLTPRGFQKMNATRLLFIVILLIAATSFPAWTLGHEHAHWQAPAKEADRKNPILADKASVDKGAVLFRTHCATCHGEQGRGDGLAGAPLDPRPTDLSHSAGHHKDGDLAWKIVNGRGGMPGWKGILTETQIWDLVNFIKTLDPLPKHGGHKGDH
jgi:mono/diheme cytochrome c family protein